MGRPSVEGKPPATSFDRSDFAARTAGTTASPVAIRAAAILGIHRNTLRKKIAELGLAPKARKRKGA